MKVARFVLAVILFFYAMNVACQEEQRITRCQRCPRCPFRFAQCRFGEEFDYCGCCKTCLKGPGERCGLRIPTFNMGKCADGLFCRPRANVQQLPQQNVCRRSGAPCFAPCIPSRCSPPICLWGTGKDICGCCDICLQGRNEPCGRFRKCGTGLDCVKRGRRQGVCLPRFPRFPLL